MIEDLMQTLSCGHFYYFRQDLREIEKFKQNPRPLIELLVLLYTMPDVARVVLSKYDFEDKEREELNAIIDFCEKFGKVDPHEKWYENDMDYFAALGKFDEEVEKFYGYETLMQYKASDLFLQFCENNKKYGMHPGWFSCLKEKGK